jgi:uncharacterized OB-fold protein
MAEQRSPHETFAEHCRRGELAYQWDPQARRAFLYPRLHAPGTGVVPEWRVSAGLGTVYATTTLHPRGGEPYDLSLVELDEGPRLMTRVAGVAPDEVAIGMRVRVRFDPAEDDGPPVPVFTPDGAADPPTASPEAVDPPA